MKHLPQSNNHSKSIKNPNRRIEKILIYFRATVSLTEGINSLFFSNRHPLIEEKLHFLQWLFYHQIINICK